MKKALKKALANSYAINISTSAQFFVAAVVLEIEDKTVTVTHEFFDENTYSTYHTTIAIKSISSISRHIANFDAEKLYDIAELN
jgi:pyrimidine deaminase RibD-like protein